MNHYSTEETAKYNILLKHKILNITISLPNNNTMRSKGACKLNMWQNLPTRSQIMRIFPNIKHNLISISQLCNASCTALFNKTRCTIYHHQKIIWQGLWNKRNGLWKLTLNATSEDEQQISSEGKEKTN